ncbi:MAG: hypothetical protein AB7S48_14345 [Bacteroidales bacterium]
MHINKIKAYSTFEHHKINLSHYELPIITVTLMNMESRKPKKRGDSEKPYE